MTARPKADHAPKLPSPAHQGRGLRGSSFSVPGTGQVLGMQVKRQDPGPQQVRRPVRKTEISADNFRHRQSNDGD